LHQAVLDFAQLFDFGYRIGHADDRIYEPSGTLPIVFWRPDLHVFQG